jgi:hypothetical protein
MHYLDSTIDYIIYYSGYPVVQRDTVMLIGYLTLMSYMPQVDMFSL